MYARVLMIVLIPIFLYFAVCCVVLAALATVLQIVADTARDAGTTLADGTAFLVRGLKKRSGA